MDENANRLLFATPIVIAFLASALGFVDHFGSILERHVPAKWHPRFWWSAAWLILGASMWLGQSSPATAPSGQTDLSENAEYKERVEEKKEEPLINLQARKVAINFKGMMKDAYESRLTRYEREWYLDYLSTILPVQIEAVCGTKERRIYERLLRDVRGGSDDIKLYFYGLEPFVTRERYLNSETPLAGPDIELGVDGPDPDEVAQNNREKITAGKPPLQNEKQDDDSEISRSTPQKQQYQPDVVPQKGWSPGTTESISPLQEYLSRRGWVRCSNCGKYHYNDFSYFASNSTAYCDNCGLHMHFEGWNRQIAEEANRINETLLRQHE